MSGWSYADFVSAGVVSDFEFIGNIIWNDTDDIKVLNTFISVTGFTVDDNLNAQDGDYVGTDPLFVDPDAAVVIGEGHRPTITVPDLTLADGSPAKGIVSGYSEAPFDLNLDGTLRTDPAYAGMQSDPVALEVVGNDAGTVTVNELGSGDLSVAPVAAAAVTAVWVPPRSLWMARQLAAHAPIFTQPFQQGLRSTSNIPGLICQQHRGHPSHCLGPMMA
ncbi:hypothetical protein ROLI_020000 [Roseobacter fucihabitans]|uniref:Uncharacterized protein n=1 Tax=Roseobacter fucihabitans TaxID=1537242 RepID=A0ABZ2BSI7_9RHOB|nr:hypothetical protein [Roseobacter litoralis]MBC6966214.1 hypothetical protein [Roseobacter litoralis]